MNTRIILAAVLCVVTTFAHAQTQRSGDPNARAMQQLQQLTLERTQLKAENDKLKKELEEAKKQLTSVTSTQTSLQARLKAAEAAVARDGASAQQNTEALEKTRAQLQELIGRFRETATALKEVEADRNTARRELDGKNRELTQCIERNVGLYELNKEVLDRYERKGVWSSMVEKEPFTQIQRTRLENLIESYRDRADDLRLQSERGERAAVKP